MVVRYLANPVRITGFTRLSTLAVQIMSSHNSTFTPGLIFLSAEASLAVCSRNNSCQTPPPRLQVLPGQPCLMPHAPDHVTPDVVGVEGGVGSQCLPHPYLSRAPSPPSPHCPPPRASLSLRCLNCSGQTLCAHVSTPLPASAAQRPSVAPPGVIAGPCQDGDGEGLG